MGSIFYSKKEFNICEDDDLLKSCDIVKSKNVLKINENFFNKKKKEDLKDKFVIFDAENSEKTREIIEKKVIQAIINPEYHKRKDYTYQADSGLDQVIVKLMKSKKIIYCLDLKKLKNAINSKNLNILKRVQQNLFLCKKYGCEIYCFGEDVSLAKSLNMF